MDPCLHSLLVAQTSVDRLLDVLGRLTVPFRELAPGRETFNPHVDGEPVLAGEVNGLAYLLEVGATCFAIDWGLLARLARELDALVIGMSRDRSEDHCEFFAARGPELVRAFWSNPRRATRPFSLGDPLPCEAACPLGAPGGVGLTAAIEAFGFPLLDDDGFDRADGDRWLTWPGDSKTLMGANEFKERLDQHLRDFWNPDYRWPELALRVSMRQAAP
jgi:hypothetical protein